jgi:glycosyltransferase involved in cell wall biosynthesis
MVVHAYYPVGETRVERQAQALIRCGYEVDVVCLQKDGEPANDTQEGVQIYRMPFKRFKGYGRAVQLLEYLTFFFLAFAKLTFLQLRRRYGVIQVHNIPDFLVFAALVPKLAGARVILDLHDLMPEFYAASFNRSLTSWPVRLVRWQERLSCRFADHVVTVTDLWKDTLIKRGLPAEKITVVMNVADNQVFRRAPATELAVKNDGRFDLIYHGTLVRRYGVDLVVRAVGLVRQEIPEIRFTVIGAGAERDLLVKLTEQLNLQEHVDFSAGILSVQELLPFIRKADIGIVPNRRGVFTDDLLPTKLMEYMAMGVPVLSSRTRAIEAYFDETMIEYFPPGDPEGLAECIMRLWSNPNRLRQLRENSARFNLQYNWPKLAAEYVALVDRLNNRSRPRSSQETPTLISAS